MEVACVICETIFFRKVGPGRPREVCSDECHKARAIQRVIKWQKDNPDQTQANRKKQWAGYYERNRERVIARVVEYSRSHPEWKRAKDAAHRARRLGSPSAERFTLDEIYERDGRTCHLCGKKVKRKQATMDHIVPASLGGPHTRANVALAHRSCNASKGNRTVGEQLRLIG